MREFMTIVESAYLGELQGVKQINQDARDKSKDMYDFVEYMESKGFKCLGEGEYGAVFTAPQFNGKYVLKVFHDPKYLAFVNYCMKNPGNPHLPNFYGKLMRLSPKINMVRIEVLKRVDDTLYNETVVPAITKIKGYQVDPEEFAKVEPSLMRTLEVLDQHMPVHTNLDLHRKNFMMRGSTVVIIDPYSSTQDDDLPFGVY